MQNRSNLSHTIICFLSNKYFEICLVLLCNYNKNSILYLTNKTYLKVKVFLFILLSERFINIQNKTSFKNQILIFSLYKQKASLKITFWISLNGRGKNAFIVPYQIFLGCIYFSKSIAVAIDTLCKFKALSQKILHSLPSIYYCTLTAQWIKLCF